MNQEGLQATGTQREGTECCAILTVVLLGVILLVPPLYTYFSLGTLAFFNYFVQDAFYYLSVAVNSAGKFYTFDGELPTNGFHPLWQYYETYLFDLIGRDDQTRQLAAVFSSSVLATTVGYLFIGLATFRITKSVLLSVLNVPGFFYLAFCHVIDFYGSPWSFMNGMESGFSVLFGGGLILLLSLQFTDPENYSDRFTFYVAIGLMSCLLIMARLDDVFLLLPISFAILAMQGRELRARVACTAAFLLPSVVFLSGYLLYNYYSVGTPLPLSGLTKAGLSAGPNLKELLAVVTSLPTMEHHSYRAALFRQIQLFFPPVLSVFLAAVVWTRARDPRELLKKWVFILALLAYVCAKAMYNFINVHVNFQGLPWYYTFSITAVNFIVCVLAAEPYRQYVSQHRIVRVCTAGIVGVVLTLHLLGVVKAKYHEGTSFYALWHDGEVVTANLKGKVTHPKLIEFDDGIINYSLKLPTIHGMGFVVDLHGYLALKNGHFLAYCYERGYNTLVFLQYLRFPGEDMSSDEIEELFRGYHGLWNQDISNFTFRVVYMHPNSGAVFVSLKPKNGLPDNRGRDTLAPSPH